MVATQLTGIAQIAFLKGVVYQYCLHLCIPNLLACSITQAPGQHV